MKINYDSLKEIIVPNFRGGEGDFFIKSFGDDYCKINIMRLQPGTYNGMHTHESDSEIFYIISGTATIKNSDGTEDVVSAGDVSYCPMGTGHSVINTGSTELVLFSVVPKHK